MRSVLVSDFLEQQIIAKIDGLERQRKGWLWFFGISATTSLFLVFWLLTISISEIINSGALDYLSLLVSDFGTLLLNWQDFVWLGVELLPVMSLVVLSATLLVCLLSLKLVVKNIKGRFMFL